MRLAKNILATVLLLPSAGLTADLTDIRNYREYSPTFSSAGQPSADQLKQVREAGFERVVYIALTNSNGALANEDALVKGLGMDYVHVPVIWDAPTRSDFYAFAGAMRREPTKRTLLHCQANFRASAFAFLYRVLYEHVPVAQAKADMNAIWTPNVIWRDFILSVLKENGVSPDCKGCSWDAKAP